MDNQNNQSILKMINELKNKIATLIDELKKRDNKSYSFFENKLQQLNQESINDGLGSILNSYSIVQYADFNKKEEELFEEIWDIAKKVKNNYQL
jgi:hypothetical protein